MRGAQEKIYDAIKQAAPHLEVFLSCALLPLDSVEQGLQASESISRISGFSHWKECMYATKLSIPIFATRHFLTGSTIELCFEELYRSILNDSFIPYPLAITR